MSDKKDLKNDFDLPIPEVPGVAIPDLKKKKEERKKSGAALGGAKPSGAAFSGARAAAGAAQGAAEATAEAAASNAGGFFAALMSSVLGQALVLAVVALLLAGGAILGHRMLSADGVAAHNGKAGPDLGGISSTVKVSQPKDGDAPAMKYAAGSGQGEIQWPQTPQEAEAAASKASVQAAQQEAAQKQAADEAKKDEEQAKEEPEGHRGLTGSKLSTNLGGASSGGFAPKFKSALPPKYGITQFGANASQSGQGGSLSKHKFNASTSLGVLGHHRGLAANSKTLAMLRGMSRDYNPKLRAGNAKATEANAAAASAQFEATDVVGAAAPASPTDAMTPKTANPGGGSGASSGDVENCGANEMWNGSGCTAINTGGTNVTPWQSLVDSAKSQLAWVKWELLAAGILCLAAGILFNCGYDCYALAELVGVAAAITAAAACVQAILVKQTAIQIADAGGSPQDKPIANAAIEYASLCGIVCVIACIPYVCEYASIEIDCGALIVTGIIAALASFVGLMLGY